MSLGATLNTAFSGLRTAQQGLNVTAHNVSNVNTEGYTRKVLAQESVVLSGRGAGVEGDRLSRLTDEFLIQEMRRQTSRVADAEVVSRYHDRLQDFIGAPGADRDIAVQVGQLAAALDGLANGTGVSANALEVVNLTESLGGSIESLANQTQRLREDADREIGLAVEEINGELESLAELNREISRLIKVDQDPSELQDKRDLLIKQLAEKIDIDTFRKDDLIVVQTGSGQTLVDDEARVLHYEPAPQVGHDTVFNALSIFRDDQVDPATGEPLPGEVGIELVSSGVRRTLSAELRNDATPDADQLITSRIESGRLAGLLEARDVVLPQFDDQLAELADGLRFALNAAHNDGAAVPPPETLTGTRTDLAGFAGATRSGTATLAVIDSTDGSTVTEFQIDVGAAADENDVVADVNAGLGGLGNATVASGSLEISLAAANTANGTDYRLAVAEGDSAITFDDAAGRPRTYGFSHYFGLNDLVTLERTRPTTLTVHDDLRADPSRISTARLDVETGPLSASLGGPGDNRAAQALADSLRGAQAVIGRGGLPAKDVSMTDYAGEIIAHGAVLAQRAEETAARDQALADALEFRAAASSGVNIDEEMTHMITLQRAYTASARIITTTEELFDELFRIAS